ncbi:MAG: mechanosensitive ion channel [Lentimicrobium sp.]|jgi:small-conductance mechanosensitive channel|nr:mechanosensitive ion channel [Lentimicrobium sp.]
MKFNEILNFGLVEFGKFSLTLLDMLIVFVIFVITISILKLLKKYFDRRVRLTKLDKGSAYTIYNLVRYLIWIIFILIVLDAVGVNLNIMLAGSAALLVGLGFGIQHIFNDLVSGVILLMEGNVKVGDIVEIENDIIGRVTFIGLRTSKINDRNDITTIIPNSKLINEKVINWSNEQSATRFFVKIGVAYGSDVELVTRLLIECSMENTAILTAPAPFVRFYDFGESSLVFQLFFWTDEAFLSEFIKSKLRYAMDKKFREHNIQIPFPQRDIHIVSPRQTPQP